MATTLTHELTYDAPLAQVAEMLMDSAFREQVCHAQGAVRATVTITEAPGGKQVVVDQVQGAQGLPSFATKFVGDEIQLVQTEQWSSATDASVEIVIPGKPGQGTGTLRLSEAGGTTTESVEIDVKVGIPLVGGKLEGMIVDLVRKALKSENEVGRRYLAG
jgi:uncharacterized protein YndB with AHSA1/START domain